MIVRSFLTWFENAPVHERVEAARVMAQTFMSGALGAESVADAEAALTLILDDPSPSVRRALAWEIAGSDRAPRHIIVALAHDQSEVAALVLARSPLLRDPDLVDCAAIGDILTQTAIALRQEVSAPVSAALAETATPEALVTLLGNVGAEIAPHSFSRMAERYPDNARLREALTTREDIPATVRQTLIAAVSGDLLRFLGKTGWMPAGRAERSTAEARESATIALAVDCGELGALVEHLRATGQLTPGLLLRGLLCGETALFGAALANLAGLEPKRVAGMLTARGQGAVSAACLRAGLPRTYLPAYLAALGALRNREPSHAAEPKLDRAIIQQALMACLESDEGDVRELLAMLRRFDAQAALVEARETTQRIMAETEAQVIAHVQQPAQEGPALIDLDAFERDLVAEPLPEVQPDVAPEAEAALVEAPREPEPQPEAIEPPARRATMKERLLQPLYVVGKREDALDESYFASWKLRKAIAA